jgi:hypothetical protein
MFKRAVRATVRAGALTVETIADATDDGLTERLLARDPSGLARPVRERQLHKRALDLPASEVPAEAPSPWFRQRPDLLERAEDRLADELRLAHGEILLDFPSNPTMLAVDLPLRTRNGGVERLTGEGRAGQFGLPRVATELYQSARRFRVFTKQPLTRSIDAVRELVGLSAEELDRRLGETRALLS